MNKFKVGDKVIALTDPYNEFSQKRKKGHHYTVKAVIYCPYCGTHSINIGEKCIFTTVLCVCNNIHETRGLAWTDSKNFILADDIGNLMEKAIQVEDYELCQQLSELT